MATHALPSSHILDDDDAPAAAHAPSRASRRCCAASTSPFWYAQMRRAQREIDRMLGPGALHRAFRTELPPQR